MQSLVHISISKELAVFPYMFRDVATSDKKKEKTTKNPTQNKTKTPKLSNKV